MALTFRIMTAGHPEEGMPSGQVLQRLTRLLKNEQQARLLLSGTPRVIKRGLAGETARKYAQALTAAGLAVTVAPEAEARPPAAVGPRPATGRAPSSDLDPKQMRARLRAAVQQVDREIGRDTPLWIGVVATIVLFGGATALAWSGTTWYWAMGCGLLAAAVPGYFAGTRMDRNEKAAAERLVDLLDGERPGDPRWPAFVRVCLQHNEIRFSAPFLDAVPNLLEAWCQSHWSPEAEALRPEFEFFLTGKRPAPPVKEAPPAPADPPPPAVPQAPVVEAASAPAPATHVPDSPPIASARRSVKTPPRPAPEPATPPPVPQKAAKKEAPSAPRPAAAKANRPAKRPAKQRPKREKAPVPRGPGLLGNLVGLVCGGIVFSLVSSLVASLTGWETLAMIVAALMGLSAWRGAAGMFQR